jgi:hypothetical protein
MAYNLDIAYRLAQDHKNRYSLEGRLLKKNRKLIITESVYTSLIIAVYYSLTIAYPGKNKTKSLIKEQYYWLGLDNNIE